MNLAVIYRKRVPAIYTSIACSLCTTIISQTVLRQSEAKLSPATQTFYSVVIFIVAYWLVYFGLRDRISCALYGYSFPKVSCFPPGRTCTAPSSTDLIGKIFFVIASEIFWILSLGFANYFLLSSGNSSAKAALIAQWGINLFVWLPLLPLWEELAIYRIPSYLTHRLGKFN